VDLGRLGPDDAVSDSWLAGADATLLVVRGDAASAVHVRDRLSRFSEFGDGRLGLVSVGGGYSRRDLEEFTGIRVVGRLPFDPAAAEVATGVDRSGRRLERSPLWAGVGRLAMSLATDLGRQSEPIDRTTSHLRDEEVASRSVRPARIGSYGWRDPVRATLGRLGITVGRTAEDLRVDA
jgi:hypothetical protein